MPQTVWVIPGFAASTLRSDAVLLGTVWVDYSALVLGGVGQLRLAANGTDPGPPDGRALESAAGLSDYYAGTISTLVSQLPSSTYRVADAGWDWRQSMRSAGSRLANWIRADATPVRPATLVGHSAGGLVARMAWYDLAGSGETALIRRIITLGAPHYGTYASVAVMSGNQEAFEQLQFLSNTIGGGLRLATNPFLGRSWSTAELVELADTWPALYELLPLLGVPTAAADPDRALLFDAANWRQGVTPAPNWLTYARDTWGPLLRDPATMPPYHVLTTLAAEGYPTPDSLIDPGQLGATSAYGTTVQGDGTVTHDSADVVGARRYHTSARHVDLPFLAAANGWLADWIQEERVPPDPPVPPVALPGLAAPILAGPPIPAAIGAGNGTGGCAAGRCSC